MKTLLNLMLRIVAIVLIPLWIVVAIIVMWLATNKQQHTSRSHYMSHYLLGIYVLLHWVIVDPSSFFFCVNPSDDLEAKYVRLFMALDKKFEVQP